MTRCLLILFTCGSLSLSVPAQSFTIEDLLALSSTSPKNTTQFMAKKGFILVKGVSEDEHPMSRYFQKMDQKLKDSSASYRSVDVLNKDNSWFYTFHTSSSGEFLAGKQRLVSAGFFYDKKKDIVASDSILFQLKNIRVVTSAGTEEGDSSYTFLLQNKINPAPSSIRKAEDLLQFDSHEFLTGFFGQKNVKKDLYYFSEKELKSCSVLFGNSSRQVVFIWKDEENLSGIAYILVSDILPTKNAEKFDGGLTNNQWMLENGIRSGLTVKDLLRMNKKDFQIYGNKSPYSFMIKQDNTGEIDFKNCIVVLSCMNCNGASFFDKETVSATDVIDNSFQMYVYYIMVLPSKE